MSQEVINWNYRCECENLKPILEEKGYSCIIAENADEARRLCMSLVPEGASIAVGGSVTLQQTGIMDDVYSEKYNFIDRFHTATFEEMLDKYREGYSADVMISSTNAITKKGQLVNIDCTGNRTGQIAFGPKKVIIVAGANKIVDTVEDGLKRAKKVAPMNARRITHKTPCATDDCNQCCDCNVQPRICNVTSVVEGCTYFPGRITVILVPEELGY